MCQQERSMKNTHLIKAREQRGWTYKDVADRIGVNDPRRIGAWEDGFHIPWKKYQYKLCELFNLDINVVFPEQGPEPKRPKLKRGGHNSSSSVMNIRHSRRSRRG